MQHPAAFGGVVCCGFLYCLFFCLMAIIQDWRPLSPVRALGTVSLRLGHGAALTCHRHVRAAPPLRYPKRGSASRQRLRIGAMGQCTPLGAPFRGVVGVSRLRGRQIRDQSRVEKRERTKYCEGRLLSRPSRFLSYVKYIYQKHRGEAVIGDDGDEVVHGRDQRP